MHCKTAYELAETHINKVLSQANMVHVPSQRFHLVSLKSRLGFGRDLSASCALMQVANRGQRMGISGSNVFLFSATRLDDVMREMYQMQPRVVIVDSIQTVYLDDVNSSAGSVSQVLICQSAGTSCNQKHDHVRDCLVACW